MINVARTKLKLFSDTTFFAKDTQKQAMSSSTSSNLWLIGAGQMAQDYVQVLKALQTPFKVIGRGKNSAVAFESAMEISVQTGGIEKALQKEPPPETAIVAVGVEQLASVSSKLLQAGTKRILLEKPGGMNLKELQKLLLEAQSQHAKVWLAYNRRFYEATRKAQEIIQEDGGVTSCHFEFTEWSHKIRELEGKTDIKAVWLLANSTHVVDLAFHLCGWPSSWQSWSAGTIDWHPSAARFSGAGVTEQGVLFSYFADWEAPGRWGVEALTRNNRLILRPMEQLQLTPLGSLQVKHVNLDDELDHDFKPGLYRQTEAFL
ncbi:MAG: Gfo/Idh/MocA family oxidoreductase, partial [Candidatus Poribacteria bacterium]|nr:Gfo/Idh/MocA family oxidoreductase [Candidatus Poribacteria bacterium]